MPQTSHSEEGTHKIVFSDKVRNLGFILDSNLTMKHHVNKICQTACCGTFCHYGTFCHQNMSNLIYHLHVLSLWHVWSPRGDKTCRKIHSLHVFSLWHVWSPRGDKTCRKVHSLHVLSLLRQQNYNLSFPSLIVYVCVCARTRLCVPACTGANICMCVDELCICP